MAETAQAPDRPEEATLRRAVTPAMLLVFVVGDMVGGGIYALVGEVGDRVGGALWTVRDVQLGFAVMMSSITSPPRCRGRSAATS